MGSAASKGARRLPKNTPTAVHAAPAVPRPPPEAAAASTPSQAQAQAPPARDLDYGRRDTALPMRPRAEDAPFSGEKDESQLSPSWVSPTDAADIIKDAMDPQFMANLAKMGQVTVHDPAHTRQVVSTPERYSSLFQFICSLAVLLTSGIPPAHAHVAQEGIHGPVRDPAAGHGVDADAH
jgi:hypothetical protein